jgi:hypothetical protein
LDLLALMQAEEQAEALVADAQMAQTAATQLALESRAKRISELKPAVFPLEIPAAQSAGVEQLRKQSAKNVPKAVRMILEELHEA